MDTATGSPQICSRSWGMFASLSWDSADGVLSQTLTQPEQGIWLVYSAYPAFEFRGYFCNAARHHSYTILHICCRKFRMLNISIFGRPQILFCVSPGFNVHSVPDQFPLLRSVPR
eukprot:2043335-Amphidinium_carterae.1